MTTFAHFAPGVLAALDPRVYDDVEAYRGSFSGVAETLWADHDFREVPDGTQHGAKDNGDGTYTNPDVTPVPTDRALTKSQFQSLLAASGNSLDTALANWNAT